VNWRELTAADTPAWADVLAAASDADDANVHYTAEDLAEDLTLPGTSVLGAFDGDRLAAVGQVFAPVRRFDGVLRTQFDATVHPEFRRRGIGAVLLARMEDAVLARARDAFPEEDVHPSTEVPDRAADACALLEARGYEVVRYYHEMVAHPQPAFRNPRLQRFRPELDMPVREAHRAAFATHWGSAPISDEEWQVARTGSRAFRPEYSTVAATIDRRVDGYVLSYQHQPDEVYIGQVGVRPELRRRGLARKLMEATLAEVAAAGIPTVRLHVDSTNGHGAGRLYEVTGFEVQRTVRLYERRS
jgi:ribosomal protein S18 acetylase RimI-like enzyme